MTQYTLTILDTSGVQSYIFGSNRLRENVGASQLVEMSTHEWIQECLNELEFAHNLAADGCIEQEKRITDARSSLRAELILQGGGNVVLLFRTVSDAKKLVGSLSRQLIRQAPGLELIAAHQQFEFDGTDAAQAEAIGGHHGVYLQLIGKLAQAKQQRPASSPLQGLSVTLECRSTGLPAVGFDPARQTNEPPYPASADVLAKMNRAVKDVARQRFKSLLPDTIEQDYALSDDFDELGRSADEHSYIAVVHADGNNMGNRFERIVQQHANPGERTCLDKLRELSEAVNAAGEQALKVTVQRMLDGFKRNTSDEMRVFLTSLARDDTGKPFLPFRPIVFGGDDVTFICDGRLGLSMAATYLAEWEKVTAHDPVIGKAQACAGVAIVKTHYPFARAYDLAEDLCKRAKRAIKEAGREHISVLDWHFALSGIFGKISDIRQREYQVKAGGWSTPRDLVMRPLVLTEGASGLKESWRTWNVFADLVTTFKDETIYPGRNKVKDLREVLRNGPAAVEQFQRAYRLPPLRQLDPAKPELQSGGWGDQRCGYFDAIEAIDSFIQLA